MKKKIPTVEELLQKHGIVVNKTDTMSYSVKLNCKNAMIEFAKLHLEAQAEAILKVTHKNGIPRIVDDGQTILNAYPLTNIK